MIYKKIIGRAGEKPRGWRRLRGWLVTATIIGV